MSAFMQFLKAALREPLQVSTVFQTTKLTAEKLAQPLIQNPTSSVMELGVGAGAVTEVLHRHIIDKTGYIGFEINVDLYEYVKDYYPSFHFVRDSAEHILQHVGEKKFDLIVSTLPWTLLPDEVRKNIIDGIVGALKPEGEFRTYMASNAIWTPAAKKFQALLNEKFDIKTEWQWLNAPPAMVFKAKKKKLN